MTEQCVVVPARRGSDRRARAVASRVGLPFVATLDRAVVPVALVVDDMSLWLQQTSSRGAGPVRVDFADPAMQHRRRGGHNELLGRAIGVRATQFPAVLDATGGLARDAYVLADLGCQVSLYERSPVLSLLLEEALAAAAISALPAVRAAAARMTLHADDATRHAALPGQVIYLDPMFPDRRSTAAVRKDLATLQQLYGEQHDEHEGEALLAWAMAQPTPRIVVKRPPKAPPLAAMRVSHAISGKAVRFDVLVRPEFMP